MKRLRYANRLLLAFMVLSVAGGCVITIGPFDNDDSPQEEEEDPSPLPAPSDAQQARRDEVDRFIAEEIYKNATIRESVALPSGDIVDFLDRDTLPVLPYELPALPSAGQDVTLPEGVTLGLSELELMPELSALAAEATPFHRPTFWPYILGETDATSIEDYLDRYQVGGQPSSAEHLYAGVTAAIPNRGISGFMNQFRPEVEPGSFSLLEFAVACPAAGAAQEVIGGVISVDKINPFGKNGQALTDSEPRMHIEYARVNPNTGKVQYDWDGLRGDFVANPLRTRHRPGETVPVSVLGGAQVEHLFTIFQSPSGDWWIAYQTELLGYYPASLFTMLNGGACRANFYGEVARWQPAAPTGWVKTEMGSGRFADEKSPNAAYVRKPKYYDPFWFTVELQNAMVTNAETYIKSCYSRTAINDGIFFLGGPGGKDAGCVWP